MEILLKKPIKNVFFWIVIYCALRSIQTNTDKGTVKHTDTVTQTDNDTDTDTTVRELNMINSTICVL